MNNLTAILNRQRQFSLNTFGPDIGVGAHDAGLIDHIEKELFEIREQPGDLMEWIDVIILAIEGAHRNGFSSEEIVAALNKKQAINEKRKWPDWRAAEPGKAIEHLKEV